jgi:dCMP deaminase
MKQEKYDRTFLEMATSLSKLSNCIMYKVGCLIVKDNRIISMGYNGTPQGFTNCSDQHKHIQPRFGPSAYTKAEKEEHHEFSSKFEVHAEMNSILFAAKQGTSIDGATMYCTLQPCNDCAKNICQAGIKRIVYDKEYPRSSYCDDVQTMIKSVGLVIEQL